MVVGYEPVNLSTVYAMEVGRRYTFQNTTIGDTGVAFVDVREADADETDNQFVARPRHRPWTLLQRDELNFFVRSPDPETEIEVSVIEQS